MKTNKQLLKSLNKQIFDLQEQKIKLDNELLLNSPELKSAHTKIGKFFRYRNCYSCAENESDYWYLYSYVKDIDLELSHYNDGNINISFKIDSFQIDKYGEIIIQNDKNTYEYLLGEEVKDGEEITKILRKMGNKIIELKKKLKYE